MKKIFDFIRLYRMFTSAPAKFWVVEKIFELIDKSLKDNKPLAAQIQVELPWNVEPSVMATVWVCRGEGNPIDRIQEMGKALEEIGRYARTGGADKVKLLVAIGQIDNIVNATLKRHAEKMKEFVDGLEQSKT